MRNLNSVESHCNLIIYSFRSDSIKINHHHNTQIRTADYIILIKQLISTGKYVKHKCTFSSVNFHKVNTLLYQTPEHDNTPGAHLAPFSFIILLRVTAILISITIPLKQYLVYFSLFLFCILLTWTKHIYLL